MAAPPSKRVFGKRISQSSRQGLPQRMEVPKIALDGLGDKQPELNVQGFIQTEHNPEGLDILRFCFRRGHEQSRVAAQMAQQEDDNTNAKKTNTCLNNLLRI